MGVGPEPDGDGGDRVMGGCSFDDVWEVCYFSLFHIPRLFVFWC